ncbi:hypothetical protein DFH27DRAFT_340221 [Peziza echinospora]|nr:hypothetical protein DFH27DRAFT_340221 [Peziza echinospora]
MVQPSAVPLKYERVQITWRDCRSTRGGGYLLMMGLYQVIFLYYSGSFLGMGIALLGLEQGSLGGFDRAFKVNISFAFCYLELPLQCVVSFSLMMICTGKCIFWYLKQGLGLGSQMRSL